MDPLSNIPTPQINLALAPSSHEKKLQTVQFLKESACFTADVANVLFSPKYSLFLQGIEMIARPSSGGYLSGMDQACGALMLAASPVYGVCRLVFGLSGIAVGSLATVGSAAAAPAEWAGRTVQKLISPSEAVLQREELTKNFVVRMVETTKALPRDQTIFFQENPEELIRISAMMVAFLSRGEEGVKLKVGDKLLSHVDLTGQDELRQSYFQSIYEMKQAIRSLYLDRYDDRQAWSDFKSLLQRVHSQEGGPTEDQKQAIAVLIAHAHQLSSTLSNDEVFSRTWNELKSTP